MWAKHEHTMKRAHLALRLVPALVVLIIVPASAELAALGTSHWEGRRIFRQKGCAECHSVFGNDGKGGPDLGRERFYGTYLELAARMWNHFPKMYERMRDTGVSFPEINPKEMEQLVTYISFLRYIGEPGKEHRGRKLLSESCMKCHKFGGSGGDIGPDFTANNEYMSSVQLLETMWNHGPDMMGVFEEHDIKRPIFKGSDMEDILTAIRSYVTTAKIPPEAYAMGDPASGETLYHAKGCDQCHSYRGVGGTLGPDFADMRLDRSATQIAGEMWNHGPQMWKIMQREGISVPAFKKGEMADIVAYLYALKLADEPGNPERGRRIIDDKKCLSCHSLQGRGGSVSEDLASLGAVGSPLEMIAAMWNHAPAMREKQREKKLKWPELKARDMADLYAFLAGITH